MWHGSGVEVCANRSEIQICATELSFFTKCLTASGRFHLPVLRGTQISLMEMEERGCMWIKDGRNSLIVLPLRVGLCPLSECGLACDCLDQWSMVEVSLFLSLPF